MSHKPLRPLETALRAAVANSAAQRFERLLKQATEAKANFNPNQPRLPRGNPRGGEWTRVGGKPSRVPKQVGDFGPDYRQYLESNEEREAREVERLRRDRELQQFIARNRDSITRVLGGLQMVGGASEMVLAATGVAAGAATAETGAGVGLAALSAWMLGQGYDNFTTGWRALVTGSPQETTLHTALRNLGLSDAQATATEILLSGGMGVGLARMGRGALEEAARAGLYQRALRAFAEEPLNVRVGTRRIWDVPGIKERGLGWEAFDAERTGFQRTPENFRVIDQFDRVSGTAISNKTLDLALVSYSEEGPNAMYTRLATYIDQLAEFEYARLGEFRIRSSQIHERRLHVLCPFGEALPGQALQIAAAEQYAAQRRIIFQVEYAR